MRKRHTALRAVLLLAAIIFLLMVVLAASIWTYGNRDETRNADVAIVLGAAASENGPSPVYRERLNQGIRLYRQGYVNKLILTGGVAEGNTRSDAAIGGEYVVEQGVPPEDILLEEFSTITEENLKYSADIMRTEGFDSALIVSDPLHMKRAMLLAKDAGIAAYSSPTSTTRYRSFGVKLQFLARELFYYTGYTVVRLFRRHKL